MGAASGAGAAARQQRADRDRIAARRGNSVARVAAARRLLTLVFYGMRDGEIPSLSATAA